MPQRPRKRQDWRKKPRRKTAEPGIPVRRTGKAGRPPRVQPADRRFYVDWKEISFHASNGATAEELALAFCLPADEATQGRLRRIVEVENARYRLLVREAAARMGVKRVGKETSTSVLQAVARNELGWDQDAPTGQMGEPNIEGVRQSLTEALEKLAKRRNK
jgi:hypothetical protein